MGMHYSNMRFCFISARCYTGPPAETNTNIRAIVLNLNALEAFLLIVNEDEVQRKFSVPSMVRELPSAMRAASER